MTSDPDEDDRPFVFRAEPFVWDFEETGAYEAAIDALHDIIGRFSAAIWKEEHLPQPNRERLNRLGRRQDYYREMRDNLRLTDQEKIAAVRLECARLRASGKLIDDY